MEKNQQVALARFGLDPAQIIHEDGRYWMTAEQLGKALGYRVPGKSVRNVINRHRKELQPFIGGINLMSPGGAQETTIIDTDGQYMIALLANTPKARTFRTFVVNMLKALERQEFVHISQVQKWQRTVLDQLNEWKAELLDFKISKYLESSPVMDQKKYSELLRYRKMGLTQRETGKLLDISRDTVQNVEKIHRGCEFQQPPLSLVKGGAL